MSTRYLPAFSILSRKRSRNRAPAPSRSRRSAPGCRCRCRHGPDRSRSAGANRRAALLSSRSTRRSGASGGRLLSAVVRMNASRSVAASSSTSRAGCSLAASSTNALSIRAGRARSITMREPPCITRPKRKALISPRPVSPALRGNWNVTCGMSMTTRYGLASVNARMSMVLSRSTTKRVCVSSPATRTSFATGRSFGARVGGPSTGPPAANAAPSRTALKRTAKPVRWTMNISAPPEPILLQYGGAVNHILIGAFAISAALSMPAMEQPDFSRGRGRNRQETQSLARTRWSDLATSSALANALHRPY